MTVKPSSSSSDDASDLLTHLRKNADEIDPPPFGGSVGMIHSQDAREEAPGSSQVGGRGLQRSAESVLVKCSSAWWAAVSRQAVLGNMDMV